MPALSTPQFMREDEFLQNAGEQMKKAEEPDSESIGEYVLMLLERIEELEESEQRPPHAWNFHIVRDAQGFIADVQATPVGLH